MATAPEIQLPEKVDEQLNAICVEKSVPQADAAARKLLLEIGEQESLKILRNIRSSTREVYNLSGYITYFVKNLRNSPSSRSPLSTPLTVTSQGSNSIENKRDREFECSAKRVVYFGSPTKIEEVAPNLSKSASDLVLDELEKLEFRKAFLILNYTRGAKLENVVYPDKIRSYQSLPMREFEIQIWNDFGRAHCGEKERIKIINWTTAERYYYHCHVDAEGNCCFKGPFLNKAATLLQKIVGDENVLIVKFMEQESENTRTDAIQKSPVFNMVVEDGIFVGRKQYRFFVYKDGGKEEKRKDPTSSPVKCYFVCLEGFATLLRRPPCLLKDMPVQEARCLFMHIHKATSLSIYMARFSLILSKTITLDLNFNDVHVEVIGDELCRDEVGEIVYDKNEKPLILTDGTGFISENLALRCPHNCYNGCVNNEDEKGPYLEQIQEKISISSLPRVPPLLIQFRMFHKGRAIKGTVLVNRKLPPNTIQVRQSMLKIDLDEELSDAPTVNSFEVVATSNKPKDAGLSKNLIALLHYGGVPKAVFLALLGEAVAKPLAVLYKIKAAVKGAVNWDFIDEYIATRMIASGIPLDEPFLQHRLSEIAKEEMKSLKGGKLPVTDTFYLMGTADPTGTLKSGEVCVILEQGQLSDQELLIYRNPGIHPGDIHVVNARYVESLKDFVGNSKYGIFFPSKGSRSMADEIAGGDYDGDMYWVSMNPELLKHFRPSEPWKNNSRLKASNQTNLPTAKALEVQLFRSYMITRFRPNYAMGIAADSWLMYMDRMLTDCVNEKAVLREKIDELIDTYYDALDAPKKGNTVEVKEHLIPNTFPHYLGKGEHRTYKSTSVLGEIYDLVDRLRAPVKFWKLKCFQTDIPAMCFNVWRNHYSNYRNDMTSALHYSNFENAAAAVYEKYRKILYGGVDELDSSEKMWKEIRLEAIAIVWVPKSI